MNVEKMTGVPSATRPPPAAACTAAMETSEGEREREERNEQALPACGTTPPRPSNGLTFARRRHSKGTFESPYLSRPRMKRRGAVSYDKSDSTAEYIRYLGERASADLFHEFATHRPKIF